MSDLSRDEYLQLDLDLRNDATQIRRLITHGPSIGSHLELLVQEATQRIVKPDSDIIAKRGFIRSGKRTSKELDLILYRRNTIPVFESRNLIVIEADPQDICGIIEVKTTLNKKSMDSTVELALSVSSLLPDLPVYLLGFESIDRYKLLDYANAFLSDEFTLLKRICCLGQYNLGLDLERCRFTGVLTHEYSFWWFITAFRKEMSLKIQPDNVQPPEGFQEFG